MSHIPASKMPHAKPHDEHDGHGATPKADPTDAPDAPVTAGPEIKPTTTPAASSQDKRPDGGAGAPVPYGVIAAVGVLAIGGIVAALALRRPEPPRKTGKGKPKGRPRKPAAG